MSKYGLTQSFTHSGDFRVLLATGREGSEDLRLFEESRKYDSLITQPLSEKAVLSYNKTALSNREEFLNKIRTHNPAVIPPVHSGGICILAGSGPSLDVEFVEKAQRKGVSVIAIGNAISFVPTASYWIGMGDPTGYNSRAFESSGVIAFYREPFKDKKLIDHATGKESSKKITDFPANIAVNPKGILPKYFFQTTQAIAGFYYINSLSCSLSLAACLGFSDIILTGIDLSCDPDNFYYKGYKVNEKVLPRKVMAYERLKSRFSGIVESFTEYGIRLCTAGNSHLPVPSYPSDFLERAIDFRLLLSKRVSEEFYFSYYSETPESAVNTHTQSDTSNKVILSDLSDNLEFFIKEAPELFDTPVVSQALSKLEEALSSGGCTGCKRNSILGPVYNHFEDLVVNHLEDFAPVWAKVLPTKDIFPLRRLAKTAKTSEVVRPNNNK